MVSGSWASTFFGEPRTTHDIDLVVELTSGDVHSLAAEFSPPRYFVEPRAAMDAVQRRAPGSMFNLIEVDSGSKVDFWMLSEEPFDAARFARRRWISWSGIKLAVSAPEDVILMKLRWGRDAGGSEKQFVDALRVYEVQHGTLDEHYLDQWALRLGVMDDLTRVRRDAVIVEP